MGDELDAVVHSFRERQAMGVQSRQTRAVGEAIDFMVEALGRAHRTRDASMNALETHGGRRQRRFVNRLARKIRRLAHEKIAFSVRRGAGRVLAVSAEDFLTDERTESASFDLVHLAALSMRVGAEDRKLSLRVLQALLLSAAQSIRPEEVSASISQLRVESGDLEQLELFADAAVAIWPASFEIAFERAAVADINASPKIALKHWMRARDLLPTGYSIEVAGTVDSRIATLGSQSVGVFATDAIEPLNRSVYNRWIEEVEVQDFAGIRNLPVADTTATMVVLIVFPRESSPDRCLQTLTSIVEQTYRKWQVCIVYDAEVHADAIRSELALVFMDSRVHGIAVTQGEYTSAIAGIYESSNASWIITLQSGDVLASQALEIVARRVSDEPNADIVYVDEDRVDAVELRHTPFFKPRAAEERLFGQDILGTGVFFNTNMVRDIGGIDTGVVHSALWELAVRAVCNSRVLCHEAYVLVHVRDKPERPNMEKAILGERCAEANRFVMKALRLQGLLGSAEQVTKDPYFQVRLRVMTSPPSVAVIVPTRDNFTVLRDCVESLLQTTEYPNYVLRIIDNGSVDQRVLAYLRELSTLEHVQVIPINEPFNFSRLLNIGVSHSHEDVIVSLNNDINIYQHDWLNVLAANAMRPDVGVVGVRLLYPDGNIQHAGVSLGLGGVAGHDYAAASFHDYGYLGEVIVQREVTAVTAAAMAVRREIYVGVGGFDEINLGVALNDVDFCLRVRELGLKNIYVPAVELVHFESKTRGSDLSLTNRDRYARERSFLSTKYAAEIASDPIRNPNFRMDIGSHLLDFNRVNLHHKNPRHPPTELR